MRAARKNIQIVFQDPYGSLNPRMKISDILREGLNVHFKKTTRAQKDELILKTLQDVGLTQDALDRYPHEFSGGQRQRLMIARAVAPKPKILMFDEATSALDNMTQKKVSESLDALKCTRIIIAHRLSTIKQCDRIIVLDHGKIIEDGKYDELIAKNGFFAELVARQRLDGAQ